MEQFDIRYLNAFFKSNEDLKVYLEKSKKIVLPSVRDKGVTTNYLLKVANDEVLAIPAEKYKHFTGNLSKSLTKAELHTYLLELTGDISTGFSDDALPKKSWLIDCIYSIKPTHTIFETIQDKVLRDFPKE